MVSNKLHPLISAGIDMLNNKDYFGYEIRNPDDPFVKNLEQWAKFIGTQFKPFSFQGMEKSKQAGEGLAGQLKSFAGVNPAPKYITNTDAQNQIGDLYTKRFSGGTKPYEQKETDQLKRDVAEQLRKGNKSEAEQLIKDGTEKGLLHGDVMKNLIKRAGGNFDEFAFKRFAASDKFSLLMDFNDESFKKYYPVSGEVLDKLPKTEAEELKKRISELGLSPNVKKRRGKSLKGSLSKSLFPNWSQ